MVAIIARESPQMHRCVVLVLVKVIYCLILPYLFPILSLISVDCTWSTWTAWSNCSASCGVGTQLRSRFIEENAQNGGSGCSGESAESKTCNLDLCPAGNVPHCWCRLYSAQESISFIYLSHFSRRHVLKIVTYYLVSTLSVHSMHGKL